MAKRSLAGLVSGLLVLPGSLFPSIALAQADSARPGRQAVPQALGFVRVSGTVVRAPDARRARHVPTGGREGLDWSVLVDSAPGGVLHATATLYQPAGANALATIRIPVKRGLLGQPTITTRPRPMLPVLATIGRDGAGLPREQAERVAVHAYMRRLLEIGALFEAEPAGGSDVRRVHFADGAGDIALVIDAVRASRILRDTTVSGRRMHLVRDSTTISLDHAALQPSRFHRNVCRTRESARGTIVGIRLVDAASHRTVVMRDTVTLHGTIASDDGMGGAFRSPLFIVSVRQSTLHDAFWQAATRREPFDMVRYDAARPQPLTRVRRDSLFAQLGSARSLGNRDSIRARLLAPGAPDATRDTTIWPRVRARSLAIGDTASAIRSLTDEVLDRGLSITTADYRMLRPSLADARTAFRIGVDRELLALNILDGLMRRPPVLAAPGESPACLPAACAAMRADAVSAQPGLQAVGLMAAMVSDPRVWTDSVIKYSARNPFLATRALWFAQGVASGAVASAKAPIPEPDAPYDAWRHWLMGRDSSYDRALRADTARLRMAQRMFTPRTVQVSPQAATAIRFAQVRSGRDYLAALRRHRDSTRTDSARALFTALLMAMGDRAYTDAELAKILLGPSSPERDVATAQLNGRGGRRLGTMPAASDSMAAVIGRHVVNMVLGDSALSRSDSPARWDTWYRVQRSVDSLPRYVVMHAYPDAVRSRAGELGFAPVDRGWELRPGDAAYLIEFGPVRQRGPFVQVAVTHSTLYSRGASRSGGYAGGFMLTLVEGPDGWTVVDAIAWVT